MLEALPGTSDRVRAQYRYAGPTVASKRVGPHLGVSGHVKTVVEDVAWATPTSSLPLSRVMMTIMIMMM